MKRTLLFFTLATLLAPSLASAEVRRACCRPVPKWYAGLSGSAVFLKDIDIGHTAGSYPAQDSQTFHIGYGLSGAVGYRIFPNIRGEFEVSFRNSETDTDTATLVSGPAGGTAAQRTLAFMANAYYDLHNSTHFTPYVGAGIGIAQIKNPRFYRNNILGIDSKTFSAWTTAYQFMGGVNYDFTAGITPMEISLGYRYFTGVDAETSLGTGFPGKTIISNDSHNFELGGKMFF